MVWLLLLISTEPRLRVKRVPLSCVVHSKVFRSAGIHAFRQLLAYRPRLSVRAGLVFVSQRRVFTYLVGYILLKRGKSTRVREVYSTTRISASYDDTFPR